MRAWRTPWGALMWVALSDSLEKAISKMAIAESDTPSICFHVDVKTRKKASGKGPYPEFVTAFGKLFREGDENPMGLRAMLKLRVSLALCELLCFLRIHGVEGLERWIARKVTVPHAWRVRTVRRKARRFYRESRRRGRVFGGPRNHGGVEGRLVTVTRASLEEKIELSWKACEVKKALPSCAVGKD